MPSANATQVAPTISQQQAEFLRAELGLTAHSRVLLHPAASEAQREQLQPAAALAGATVSSWDTEAAEGATWQAFLQHERFTHVLLPAEALPDLAATAGSALSALEAVVCCNCPTDRIRPETLLTLQAASGPGFRGALVLLGLTARASSQLYHWCPPGGAAGNGWNGRLLPGYKAFILNKTRKLVPQGIAGDVYLTHPNLDSLGAAASRLVPNPFQPAEVLFQTEHSARRLADGHLAHLTHGADLLPLRGTLLPGAALEQALALVPEVEECRLIGSSTAACDIVSAFVVSDLQLTAAQLRDWLPSGLEWLQDELLFWQLPALPRTPTGQPDDKLLRELLAAHAAGTPLPAPTEPGQPVHLPTLLPGLMGSQAPLPPGRGAAEENFDEIAPTPVADKPAFSAGSELWFEHAETFGLGAALTRAATAHPTHGIRFVGGLAPGHLTYPALEAAALALLAGLQATGLPPGTAVLLQLPDNESIVTAVWACLLGGFVVVPLGRPRSYTDDSDALRKLRNVYRLLDRPVVLTSAALQPALAQLSETGEFNCLAIENLQMEPGTPRRHLSDPDEVAVRLFTSGSTGLPKGVELTHRAIVSRSRGAALLNGLTPSELSLNWMPLDHVGGLIMFHLHDVCLGCQQVQAETEAVLANPLRWLDWLSEFGATVTWAPNFAFALLSGEAERLAEAAPNQWNLRPLRHILNGGEAVSAEVASRFLRLLAPFGLPASAIFPAYGMSETCSGITHSDRFDPIAGTGLCFVAKSSLQHTLRPAPAGDPGTVSFVEVGLPMPGVQLRVVDAADGLMTERRIGRVQVRGTTLARGYYHNEEANRAFGTDGWFSTGDLGFLADGRLSITGREKDVVILNGLNYYNYEIEAVVEAVAGVEPNGAVAFGWLNPHTGLEELVVLFVPTDRTPGLALAARIRPEVSRRLGISPTYLLPIARAELACTASGKKQRNLMLAQFEHGTWAATSQQLDLHEQNERTLPAWFFRRTWHPQPVANRPEQPLPAAGGCLLVRRDDVLGEAIADGLRHRFPVVAELIYGSDFAELGPLAYRIRPGERADFGRAVTALHAQHPHLHTLVHAPLLHEPEAGTLTPARLVTAQQEGILALLNLIQSWPVPVAREVKLLVMTSQAQAVHPDEPLAYEHSTLPGFLKSAALEMPWLRCCHVDVPATEALRQLPVLLDELSAPRNAAEVAWRGGMRYVAGLSPVRPDFTPDALPRSLAGPGFYLVSGGLGGVGTVLARHLLEAYGLRLLLIGRTDVADESDEAQVTDLIPNPNRRAERHAARQQLLASSGTWAYEVADVCDAERLEQLVSQYEKKWGLHLAGVLHLAGTGSLAYHWQHHDEHQIQRERPATFEWMLAAKGAGTLALHAVLRSRPHASFVAFSSVNSYFGGGGFSAYSAASSFLDGFCHHLRQAEGRRAHCLHWSAWHELGMNHGNPLSRLAEAKGFRTLSVVQGLHSFDVAVRLDQPAVYIGLDGTRSPVARHLPGLPGHGHLLNETLAVGFPSPATAPDLTPPSVLETQLLAIWAEVLKRPGLGRHDNFFDLGGQSISAVRLVGRMRQLPGVVVQLQDLFRQPTIAGLAALVAAAPAIPAAPVALAPSIPALPPQPHYAASFVQLQMWLACLRDPANARAYHVASALEFNGPFRPDWFGQVVGQLVARHEPLRTSFMEVDGELRQAVHAPPAEVPFPVTDLRGLPDPDTTCRTALAAAHAEPFDLAVGPLFRAHSWQLADERYVVFITMHHLVADGSSSTILLREIMAHYESLRTKLPAVLAVLPIHYKDYAAWHTDQLRTGALAPARAYWQTQLAGALPAVGLPSGGAIPAVPTGTAGSLLVPVSQDLSHQLAEFSSTHGFSLFVLIRAALLLLLQRRSGATDIVIGASVDGRRTADLENQVGPFLHVLPLRDQVNGESTPLAFIQQVQQTGLLALIHAEYPYQQLLDEQNFTAPLFDVLLVVQNFERVKFEIADLEISDFGVENHGSKYGLSVFVAEVPGAAPRLKLHYDAARYSPAAITDVAARLTTILAVLCRHGAAPTSLSSLDLTPPHEQPAHQLFCQLPAPKRPGNVADLFGRQVARRPGAVALVDAQSHPLSYSELAAHVYRLTQLLHSCGVGPGLVVMASFGRDPRLVAVLLATLQAGVIYLPLDPRLPAPRWTTIVGETNPRIVFTDPAGLPDIQARLDGGELDKLPAAIVCLATDWQVLIYCPNETGAYVPGPAHSWPADAPPAPPAYDLGAYLFYTSGSTGVPKAVLGSSHSLAQFIEWELTEFQLNESLQSSWLIQPGFDASLRDVLLPLCAGGTLHLPPAVVSDNPAALLDWLAERQINLLHTVPSVLRAVVATVPAGGPPLPSLRLVLLAGEKVYKTDLENIKAVFGPQAEGVNLYGASETTMIKTFARVPDPTALPGPDVPVGRPMADTLLAVVNGQQLALPGEEGEVYLKSAYFSMGYWQSGGGRGVLTVQNPLHQQFADPVYRTGDRGFMLPDGQLALLGRTDRQVKRHGIRFDLRELENALLSIEGIAQQAVVGHAAAPGELWIGAFFVRRAGALLPLVPAALAATLPPQLLPDVCQELDALPLTSTGKVDLRRLLDYCRPAVAAVALAPVLTASETQVMDIFRAVLACNDVPPEASFFDQGGNSLKAMVAVGRLLKSTGLKLGMDDFFQNPSVQALGKLLAHKQAAADGSATTSPTAWSSAATGAMIPLLAPAADYAVSPAQRRLWVLHHLEDHAASYNVKRAYRLRGPLDVPALADALRKLVARHESLRTTFILTQGELRQQVHSAHTFPVPLVEMDLRADPHAERTAQNLASADAHAPFDLGRGPLLRLHLLRLTESEYVLLFATHHIISDGWSMGILMREVVQFYHAYRSELPVPLAPLRVHYKEFAAWQLGQLAAPDIAPARAYWLNRFREPVEPLQLQTDFARPPHKTTAGQTRHFSLSLAVAAGLRQLGRTHDATLFMTLVGVVNTLLYRLSGQTNIVLGTPVAGRTHPDLEGQLGMYVNTLALRQQVEGTRSFVALLAAIRDDALQAFTHQHYPFDQLVDELGLARDLSRSPLFDVFVALQNHEPFTAGLEGIEITPVPVPSCISRFDLFFNFYEDAAGLHSFVEYSTDLFTEERIELIFNEFAELAAAAIAHPTAPLDDLNILSPAQEAQLLGFENGPNVPVPANLPLNWWAAIVARQPATLAVAEADGFSLTYHELEVHSNLLAGTIQAHGLLPGDVVAVALPRSAALATALLACWKTGTTYLPIDLVLPVGRRQFMLTDSQAQLLLLDVTAADTDWGPVPRVLLGAGQSATAPEVTWQPVPVRPEVPAYIIYTSGSTGMPKGVVQTFACVGNLVQWQSEATGSAPRLAQFAAVGFDVSVQEMAYSLCTGGTLFPVSEALRQDPRLLAAFIQAQRIEHLILPFSALNLLFQDEVDLAQLTGLRHLMTSGEALQLTPTLSRFLQENPACSLHNQYGPTETHVVTSYTLPSGATALRPPIGRPLPNTEILVLDARQRRQPVGVRGEIFIGGAGLATGYLRRPGLTARQFIAHPFRPGERLYASGDLGHWTPSGELCYGGRNDGQLKIRGYRVELGEVERTLLIINGLREAVVDAQPGTDGQLRLVAYVVWEEEMSVPDLLARLRHTLPDYMLPSAFVALESLPRSANGKIARSLLPAPTGLAPITVVGPAPVDDLEVALLDIWQQVLARDLSTTDNFFEAGGSSLKALKMVSQVQQHMGRELPLLLVYRSPTVRALAEYLRHAQTLNLMTLEQPYLLVNPTVEAATRPALFIFPPAMGYALSYQLLGHHLPDYALYSFNFLEDESSLAFYVDTVQRLQPVGPLVLLGHSAGGFMAFHLAKALERAGRTVGAVIVLDAYRGGKAGAAHDEATVRKGVDDYVRHKHPDFQAYFFAHEYLREKTHRQVVSYFRFLHQAEDGQPMQAPLHLLKAEGNYQRPATWAASTRAGCVEHHAHGSHSQMTFEPWVMGNATIIEGIAAGVRGFSARPLPAIGTDQPR